MGVLLMPTAIRSAAIRRARLLRRNMTEGERKLWSELREFRRLYGIHVRQQAPIGPYVVDFVIHERHLVIEVDGEHHFTTTGLVRDRIRDEWFAAQGYNTLRFNTGELSDSFEGCVVEILHELGLFPKSENTPPPRPPPPQGGGDRINCLRDNNFSVNTIGERVAAQQPGEGNFSSKGAKE